MTLDEGNLRYLYMLIKTCLLIFKPINPTFQAKYYFRIRKTESDTNKNGLIYRISFNEMI